MVETFWNKRKIYLDLTFHVIEYIDLSIIKALKLETELLGEWTKLAEKLANVFSHVEYLGASFVQVR